MKKDMNIALLIACLALLSSPVFRAELCFGNEKAEEKKFVYDSHGRRDPFLPVFFNDTATVIRNLTEDLTFVLEGIIWEQAGRSMAIINDQILGEHDKINGFEIVRVKQNEVVLSKDGKEISLFLMEEDKDENKQ